MGHHRSRNRCSDSPQDRRRRALQLLVVQPYSGQATTYSFQVKDEKHTVAGGSLAQALVFERYN